MNGLLGLGIYQSLDDLARLGREVKVFRPRMRPQHAARNYAGWQRAVRRVL